MEEAWKPATAGWLEERTNPAGEVAYFLKHHDGHCVFLRDDNLCAIHGLYGAEAKPSFCREYPLHIVDAGDTSTVIVRASCGGYHKTYENGRLLSEHAVDVLALPRTLARRRFEPEQIELLPGLTISLSRWSEIESSLIDIANQNLPVDIALLTMRQRVFAHAGQPLPASDANRARLAAGAVLEGLRRLMVKAVDDVNADPFRRKFADQAQQLLTTGLQNLAQPRKLSPTGNRYMTQLLRSFLLARGWQTFGGVCEGLGLFLLQYRLVVAASAASADDIGADGAGPTMVTWTRMTENRAILGILKMARPALIDLLLLTPEVTDGPR